MVKCKLLEIKRFFVCRSVGVEDFKIMGNDNVVFEFMAFLIICR